MKFRFILAFVVLAMASLSAQTFRGTILGTVTDPTGAVVAGARVMAHSNNTGLGPRQRLRAGMAATASPSCQLDAYDLTVTQTGFQTFVRKAVAVDVASERRVDAALKTGEVSTGSRSPPINYPSWKLQRMIDGWCLDCAVRREYAGQWSRLYEVDFSESRGGRIARSDIRFSGIVRRVSA